MLYGGAGSRPKGQSGHGRWMRRGDGRCLDCFLMDNVRADTAMGRVSIWRSNMGMPSKRQPEKSVRMGQFGHAPTFQRVSGCDLLWTLYRMLRAASSHCRRHITNLRTASHAWKTKKRKYRDAWQGGWKRVQQRVQRRQAFYRTAAQCIL